MHKLVITRKKPNDTCIDETKQQCMERKEQNEQNTLIEELVAVTEK